MPGGAYQMPTGGYAAPPTATVVTKARNIGLPAFGYAAPPTATAAPPCATVYTHTDLKDFSTNIAISEGSYNMPPVSTVFTDASAIGEGTYSMPEGGNAAPPVTTVFMDSRREELPTIDSVGESGYHTPEGGYVTPPLAGGYVTPPSATLFTESKYNMSEGVYAVPFTATISTDHGA
jgi:hypothetical protein